MNYLVLGDITKMKVDAIVNAAHTDLMPYPGICSSIFAASDSVKLKAACKAIGSCPISEAVITPSFGLDAKYIIHVAGSGWYSGEKRETFLLQRCYINAMTKGRMYGVRSIAFPLIFSGSCHFPRYESLKIAYGAIEEYTSRHRLDVYLVLYKESIFQMASSLIPWPVASLDGHPLS